MFQVVQSLKNRHYSRVIGGTNLSRLFTTHEMRNEMHLSNEMPLDRPSLNLHFLRWGGISMKLSISKRYSRNCLWARLTQHRLFAVISLRIPWARGSPLQSECSRGRPSWSPCQLATISHAPRSIRKGAPVWRSSYYET